MLKHRTAYGRATLKRSRPAQRLYQSRNAMQTVSHNSVANLGNITSSADFIALTTRKVTPAQKAVASLTPIFNACRSKGLPITEGNRLTRMHVVNMYFHNGALPFMWIVDSFKELMKDPGAVEVIADAIEGGALTW